MIIITKRKGTLGIDSYLITVLLHLILCIPLQVWRLTQKQVKRKQRHGQDIKKATESHSEITQMLELT